MGGADSFHSLEWRQRCFTNRAQNAYG